MKKFILLLFTLILSLPLLAQLEVKEGSFKEVPGFVNINPDQNYQYDDNDLPFAVIKVRTENINDKQRRELRFESNMAVGIVLEYKTGEVWCYVTAKYVDYLKISHPDFSSIEFTLPFDLQPKKGYEMTLAYKSIPSEPVKEIYNYLIVKADQSNAVVYIDDDYVGETGNDGVFSSFKAGSKHSWRIECDMYHFESGEIVIPNKDGDNAIIDKVLRPAFGYLNITSNPESEAIVYIDGKKVGQTPYKSERLASGEHQVKVMKEMFYTAEKIFTVTDGNITQAPLTMTPNFASVKIMTDSESTIYIDNVKKSKGSWIGRLKEGQHTIEARKESHKPSIKNIQLVNGNNESIIIPNPEPIYGTLDIVSSPIGANIIIDGKNYGTTPRILTNVLIGSHELRLEKTNHVPVIKTITLNDKNKLTINENLGTDYKTKSQILRKKLLSKNPPVNKEYEYDDLYINFCIVKEFPNDITHTLYYTIDSIYAKVYKGADAHDFWLVCHDLDTDQEIKFKIGGVLGCTFYDNQNSFIIVAAYETTNYVYIYDLNSRELRSYKPFELKGDDDNYKNCEYIRFRIDTLHRSITSYKLLATECSWWSEKVVDSITCRFEDL